MHQTDSFFLTAGDGHRIAVSRQAPVHPEASLVLAGGTGIARRFYSRFVDFLVDAGFCVYTFDYRGMGQSREPGWPEARLRMADWGRRDLHAVLTHAKASQPALPLVYVGHSVGGQIFGLAAAAPEVTAALLIASQSGYWRLWPGRWRLRRWLDWHLVMPLLTSLAGRLPGWVLGGASLPRGIAREWGRWCRHPQYLNEAGAAMRDHFAALRIPMRFYQISDDDAFAPLAAVRALQSFYPVAGSELVRLSPSQAGLETLGHFGAFRASASGLWPDFVHWLRRQAGLPPQAYPQHSPIQEQGGAAAAHLFVIPDATGGAT